MLTKDSITSIATKGKPVGLRLLFEIIMYNLRKFIIIHRESGTSLTIGAGPHNFPFGNPGWEFWTTFQKVPFSPEIFRLGNGN